MIKFCSSNSLKSCLSSIMSKLSCLIIFSLCLVECYQCQHHVTVCLMSINMTPTGINRSFYQERTPSNYVAQQTLFSSMSHLGRCCCQDSCLTARRRTVSNCDQSLMMQAHKFVYDRGCMGIGVTLISMRFVHNVPLHALCGYDTSPFWLHLVSVLSWFTIFQNPWLNNS